MGDDRRRFNPEVIERNTDPNNRRHPLPCNVERNVWLPVLRAVAVRCESDAVRGEQPESPRAQKTLLRTASSVARDV